MGISKTENGKFRVFVSVKGRGRSSKTCDTHDEALATEEKLRKALIDGKAIPAGRARVEATLEEACEACIMTQKQDGKILNMVKNKDTISVSSILFGVRISC